MPCSPQPSEVGSAEMGLCGALHPSQPREMELDGGSEGLSPSLAGSPPPSLTAPSWNGEYVLLTIGVGGLSKGRRL